MLNRAMKPRYLRPLTVSTLGLVFMLISMGCNLARPTPTITPAPTNTPMPLAVITDIATSPPTLLPLPSTRVPVTSVPSLNGQCQVYMTYSGSRPDNKLSLRADPSANAPQLFRVPNNVEVLRVPGSEEVEADGYHWLNVIYSEATGMRYVGWIARDSYEIDGVRNPTVATLRLTGTQRPC
jgi:hypothetical protein